MSLKSTLAINPWRANIEVWGWEIWKPWFQEIIIGPVCQSQVTPHDEWWIDVPLLLLDEWTYHFPIPHTRKYLIQNTREIQRFWPKFNTPQNPLLMLFIHSSFSANHTSKYEWGGSAPKDYPFFPEILEGVTCSKMALELSYRKNLQSKTHFWCLSHVVP